MPDTLANGTLVELLNKTIGALGPVGGVSTSDSDILSETFPNSPINGTTPTMTDKMLKEEFNNLVMRGTDGSEKNPQTSQGYYSFQEPFNRNYVGYGSHTPLFYHATAGGLSSDADAQQYQNPGDPASVFVPNLMTAPDADPTKQPEPSESVLKFARNGSSNAGSGPFVGLGTLMSPAMASQYLISNTGWVIEPIDDHVFNNYMYGRSGVIWPPQDP